MTKRKKNGARVVKRQQGPEFIFDEVVVPAPLPQRAQPVYFPFTEMGAGRSFTTKRHLATLLEAIRRHKKAGHPDETYKVRPLPDGGCRVWRVK